MELRSLRERLKMRVAAELDLTRDVEDAEIARMIDRSSCLSAFLSPSYNISLSM